MSKNNVFKSFMYIRNSNKIKDTYLKLFEEYKNDVKEFSNLVKVLSSKAKKQNIFEKLLIEADKYACDTYKDKDLRYYLINAI